MKPENKEMRLMYLLKRINDPRCPRFGGFGYRGHGVGMGRLLLAVTAHAWKRNGKVVLTNGAY